MEHDDLKKINSAVAAAVAMPLAPVALREGIAVMVKLLVQYDARLRALEQEKKNHG